MRSYLLRNIGRHRRHAAQPHDEDAAFRARGRTQAIKKAQFATARGSPWNWRVRAVFDANRQPISHLRALTPELARGCALGCQLQTEWDFRVDSACSLDGAEFGAGRRLSRRPAVHAPCAVAHGRRAWEHTHPLMGVLLSMD